MSSQAARPDEIHDDFDYLARAMEAADTDATVQPSRSSKDLWPKLVAAGTVPWGVALESLL